MSNFTLNDWVSFLISERDVAYNSVLNYGAILLAFVAVVFSTKSDNIWLTILAGIVTAVFVVYSFIKIFNPYGRRGKKAEIILKKIMNDTLKTSDDIKKEWLANTK